MANNDIVGNVSNDEEHWLPGRLCAVVVKMLNKMEHVLVIR